MTGPIPNWPTALTEAHWQSLFNKALFHATDLVNRYRWRGDLDGVPPDGYDPNAIASQAVADLLQSADALHHATRNTRHALLPDGYDPNSIASEALKDLLLFLSRKRHPQPSPPTTLPPPSPAPPSAANPASPALLGTLHTVDIERLLRRFIHRLVDRLHRRQENYLLRNELNLPFTIIKDRDRHKDHEDDYHKEILTAIQALPDDCEPTPSESFESRESCDHLLQLKTQFLAFLGNQRRLKTLFRLLCAGTAQPKTLARKLRLPVSAINNLKKRLHAQIQAFQQAPNLGRNSSAPSKNCKNISLTINHLHQIPKKSLRPTEISRFSPLYVSRGTMCPPGWRPPRARAGQKLTI